MSSTSNEATPPTRGNNGVILNSKRTLRSARSSATSTSQSGQPQNQNNALDPLEPSDPLQQSDHYLLMEIKDGEEENEIDFVLTKPPIKDGAAKPTECVEEIEFTETAPMDADNNPEEEGKILTIVEHICGKCYQFFRSIRSLKRHIEFCNFNSDMMVRRAEMLDNIAKIEKEAFIMEKKDVCFCCGDSYDICHLGHINCVDCPKTFKSQLSLERHMFLIHSEKDDFPCPTCNGKIRTKALLQLHIEQHKNRGKPFACKTCGKDFTRKYHLKRHEKFSPCNSGESETFKCKVCDREFYRLDNLRAHLKSHLGAETTKKQEYACPCCKNWFYSLSTLNVHIRTHTGERPFNCDLCDKNFPSLVSLKKHRRYHTGEKPYCCSVCNQHFAVKEVLNRHMKRHTDDKPHVCPECGKRFIQATQLKKHINVHRRPYECSFCPEKFKTEKQAEKHMKMHTKLSTRKVTKKYLCLECDMQFFRRYSLQKHENTLEHIEKATKVCEHCNQTFVGIKMLQFHILKEHDSVKLNCSHCNQIFDRSDLLQQHIINNHQTPSPMDIDRDVDQDKNQAPVVIQSNEILCESQQQFGQPTEENGLKTPLILKTESLHLSGNVKTEQGCFIIEEFIVDALPIEKVQQKDNKEFTVIANANDASAKKHDGTRSKNLKAELKKLLQDKEEDDHANAQTSVPSSKTKDDLLITKNVGRLLDMLVDIKTLSKFGWPDRNAEEVLCKVIENCGHDLQKEKFSNEYGVRMREYVKVFFTVVVQNDSTEELLNNYTIDEVIELVLSNEEDE